MLWFLDDLPSKLTQTKYLLGFYFLYSTKTNHNNSKQTNKETNNNNNNNNNSKSKDARTLTQYAFMMPPRAVIMVGCGGRRNVGTPLTRIRSHQKCSFLACCVWDMLLPGSLPFRSLPSPVIQFHCSQDPNALPPPPPPPRYCVEEDVCDMQYLTSCCEWVMCYIYTHQMQKMMYACYPCTMCAFSQVWGTSPVILSILLLLLNVVMF